MPTRNRVKLVRGATSAYAPPMFTGIVEACVPVRGFSVAGSGARLVLPAPPLADWEAHPGQSIAVSGVCLTVAALQDVPGSPRPDLAFDLSRETLERTWFGALRPGRPVNLERALRLGDRLDGHMVSGHVDGIGRIAAIEDVGDGGREFTFEVAGDLARFLVDKGSVTLDGVSLTVVAPADGRFRVAVIPMTLEVTSLGRAEVGWPINVEADLVGKWIERLLPAAPPTGGAGAARA